MSGAELAALIVAITGALGTIFAGWRNLRGDKVKGEVEAAAAVLAGYTSLASSLQDEMTRLKESNSNDRREWVQEKLDMRAEHAAEVKELRDGYREELRLSREQIENLASQLYVMNNRPPEMRERTTDREQ